MKSGTIWLVLSVITAAVLLLASCAPVPAPTPTPTAPTASNTAAAPAPASAPVKPAAPTAPASSGEPKYGGTITFSDITWTTLDPYRNNRYGLMGGSLVWEKWVMGDWSVDRKQYDYQGWWGYMPERYTTGQLIESYEIPDPQTCILHVRKGVRWQNKPPVNGRELTSDDILWNIQRHRKGPFYSIVGWETIDTAKALDKHTVEIKLKPPPRAEMFFTIIDTNDNHMAAKESVRNGVEITDWRDIVGTGPFMIEEFLPDSVVYFKRNPDYWGVDKARPQNRLPYIDTVKWLLVADRATRLAALRTGKLDMLHEVQWQEAANFKQANPEIKQKLTLMGSPQLFVFRIDKKPFTDVRVRQALNMAVNRQEMISKVYGGNAIHYFGRLDPNMHGDLYTPYDKMPDKPMWTTVSARDVLSYNPEKAKQLLADAGYPNGFSTEIVTTAARDQIGLAEVVQSYLTKIGVKAQIKDVEAGAFDAIRWGFQHEQMLLYWYSMTAGPLQSFDAHRITSRWNMSQANDPIYEGLYVKAEQTFNDKERGKLEQTMDLFLVEQAWGLSLPWPQLVTVWQPRLSGYQGEGACGAWNWGPTFANIWIDQAAKRK